MNLSDTWQTWLRVLTNPNEVTFEAERQKAGATLATAAIWMVIAGLITGVVGFLQSMMMAGAIQGAIPQLLAQLDLPPETEAQLTPLLNSGALGGMGAANLWAIVSVPLGFLIGVGILWLLARLLGGTGEYGRYAYLMAAFAAPLTILSALLGLIPLAGSCIAFIVYIYQLVLTYYATKVEHQLSSGRAITVVLIPVIVALLLILCFVFLLVGMLATLMQVGS